MNRRSPNNNRRVRWRWLLRWKNALNHDYKNNNGRNFQFTKFSFIDFVLTDRKSLSGKRPKSASGRPFSWRFSFSAARNANTKATEYLTFGFSFGTLFIFPFQESLNGKISAQPHTSLYTIYGALFFSVSSVRCTCIIKYGAVRKFFQFELHCLSAIRIFLAI